MARIDAGVEDQRSFRLGFLLHLDGDIRQRQAWQEGAELLVARDGIGLGQLGLDDPAALLPGNEHVSTPAWSSPRSPSTRRGTGVCRGALVFPLKDPFQVANDVATTDERSIGSLELGVGFGKILNRGPHLMDAFSTKERPDQPVTPARQLACRTRRRLPSGFADHRPARRSRCAMRHGIH